MKILKWALCVVTGFVLVIVISPAMSMFYGGLAPLLMLPIGMSLGWTSCCLAEWWSENK
jgi:hypothetical protein